MADISPEGLIGCGVLLVAGIRQWRHGIHRARLIEDVATSKIRSAAQGVAELIGTCRAAAALEYRAPITGEPCTWYRYKIQRLVRHRKSSSWHTVADEQSASALVLEDETGRCTIHPKGAQVTTTRERSWTFSTGFGTANSHLARLRTHSTHRTPAQGTLLDVALRGLGARGRIRVKQWLLCDGDPLYALGDFRTHRAEDTVAHELREPTEARIHFLISNMDQATIVAKHRRKGMWGLAMIVLGTAGYLIQGFAYWG